MEGERGGIDASSMKSFRRPSSTLPTLVICYVFSSFIYLLAQFAAWWGEVVERILQGSPLCQILPFVDFFSAARLSFKYRQKITSDEMCHPVHGRVLWVKYSQLFISSGTTANYYHSFREDVSSHWAFLTPHCVYLFWSPQALWNCDL